ncbi:hypothetical protein [Mycobacterium saskatchewanense]|uniref:hypothetical protein n=1 Tax=Mycobacterium saskatchewanense TaxID=220927 RepID=UPI0013D663A7|nr:hypothetical protein [Mycobacterium saskatchewanense]
MVVVDAAAAAAEDTVTARYGNQRVLRSTPVLAAQREGRGGSLADLVGELGPQTFEGP